MKKFYENATILVDDDGYLVALDGRTVKTPGKQKLLLPTKLLAETVAQEWNAQDEDIIPDSMPITQLSNTAIDRVMPNRDAIIEELVGYAHTDLVCYREDSEQELINLQTEQWQPVLDWLSDTYGIQLRSTSGILPIAQSDSNIAKIKAIVSEFSDHELTAFHECVKGLGSLALGLAVVKGFRSLDLCWQASILEQTFQEKAWGTDSEVAEKRSKLKKELAESMKYLDLVQT